MTVTHSLTSDVFASLVCTECADVLWLDARRGQKSTVCIDKVILASSLAPDHAHTKTAKYLYPLMDGMRILPERSK